MQKEKQGQASGEEQHLDRDDDMFVFSDHFINPVLFSFFNLFSRK
jgi:hypothetical protein